MRKFTWDYICQLCYTTGTGEAPDDWHFEFQGYGCPSCIKKLAIKGTPFGEAVGGCYATVPDPRE